MHPRVLVVLKTVDLYLQVIFWLAAAADEASLGFGMRCSLALNSILRLQFAQFRRMKEK